MGEFTEKDQPIQLPPPETLATGAVQNFKEFSSGAGSTIFKANAEGVFLGATNYTDANLAFSYTGIVTAKNNSTTSSVILDGTTGRLQFKYNGTSGGSIWEDSSFNIVFYANTSYLFQNLTGSVQWAQITVDGIVLPSNKAIYFTGGTTISDTGSNMAVDRKIEVDGAVYPKHDNTAFYDLGASDKRWKTVYSVALNTGDINFSDRYCPICEKEFEVGDSLVNFVYKKTVTPFLISTVPAHSDCAKDYKKEKHQEIESFIKQKTDIRNADVRLSEIETDRKNRK